MRHPSTDPPARPSARPSPHRSAPTPARSAGPSHPRRTAGRRARERRYDDTPDTAEALRRLTRLPDGPERDVLRSDIIAAWTPVSERLAGRFRNRGESIEDLRQVAALGLVKAVNRYDPDRGTPFVSFAVPTIVGEVKRHFRDNLWDLHVPRHVQELRNQVYAARSRLLTGLDERGPTVADIAAHTRLTEDEVRAGLAAIGSFAAQSLDEPLRGAESQSLLDTLGSADPALDTVIDREAVKPYLHRLPRRARRILYLRFFQDMSQSQIAQELGISQMHVSRLISRTCTQLREQALAAT